MKIYFSAIYAINIKLIVIDIVLLFMIKTIVMLLCGNNNVSYYYATFMDNVILLKG